MSGGTESDFGRLGQKVARNTASNAVGRMWAMALQFLLTPYVVARLGDERFGIWAFVMVIVGYFAVFDLGLSTALVKYVSEHSAKREHDLLNKTINSAFTVMTLLVGAISALGLVFSRPFLQLFKISPHYYSEARFALIGALLILLGQASLAVFQAVLNGFQRMDLFNLVGVVTSIPNAVGVVLFLHYGYGLRGLVLNNAIVFLMGAVLTLVFVYRAYPDYKFRPLEIDRTALRKLLGFGAQMQLNNIGALIVWHGDKVLIAYFLSMPLVTAYELGYRIATTAKMVPGFLLPAVMPAAAEVHATRDFSHIQRLFDVGSRYLALITFPAMVFVIYDAPLVMAAWMKELRPEAVWAARLLGVGFLINMLGGVGTSIARAMDRPDLETRTLVPQLVLNFGLCIPLIIKFGFWGPLIATPVSTVLATVYVLFLIQSRLHIGLRRLLGQGIWIPALAALFSTSVAGLCQLAFPWSAHASRPVLVAHLLLQALIFFLSYLLFVWKVKLGDASDWNLVKNGLELTVSPVSSAIARLPLARRLRRN